jgi:SAM-dependent methyltransferase
MSASSSEWEKAVLWLREQPGQQALVRDCFYDDPLGAAAQRYHASSEWRAVRALLPASAGRALDIGAGRGISSYALARDGWRVTALEPDPSDVVGAGAIRALAGESGLSIDVAQDWGEQLPFADASFDLVHCRQALHHARDLRRLCAEIGRVMKPGAVFIATREHVISRSRDLQAFLDGHPLHHRYGGEHAYRLRDYVGAIEAGGIRIDRILNPLQSDINLFPQTREGIRARIARRLALPSPKLVPLAALGWLGGWLRRPGRLYTFTGSKPLHG